MGSYIILYVIILLLYDIDYILFLCIDYIIFNEISSTKSLNPPTPPHPWFGPGPGPGHGGGGVGGVKGLF